MSQEPPAPDRPQAPDAAAERRIRAAATVALLAAIALYAAFLVRHASYSVGASDSSGYLNLARLLARGATVERVGPLERFGLEPADASLFIPLGFVRGPRPGTMAPYYSPGLPAHMALAASVLGWELGPFLVSPLAALCAVLLIYAVARELGLTRNEALACSLLLALHPVVLYFGLQPMSDVLAMTWALATLLTALRARRNPLWAYPAGASLAIACAVRPSNALLALPLLLALPWSGGALARAAAAASPFLAWLLGHNLETHGHLFSTGYGSLEGEFARAFFKKRFGHYTHWLGKTLTPAIPLAWLAVVFRREASWRDRTLLLAWFAPFFFFYCFYRHYEQWWNLRFLLPGLPAVLIGAVLASRPVWRAIEARLSIPGRALRSRNLLPYLALAAAVSREVTVFRAEQAIRIAEWDRIYPDACRWAAATLPEKSLVLCMLMSGALKHYTALTGLRYDLLAEGDYARLHARLEAAGYRPFALLHPSEVEQFRRQAPAPWKEIGSLRHAVLLELDAPPRSPPR